MPIAVPAIAPSTPEPVASRTVKAISPSTGLAVSATTKAVGRRSSQSVMSAILNTSQTPASTPAQTTRPSSSGEPSRPSASGRLKSTTRPVPIAPSTSAQARPVPRVRGGEAETTSSSSSSSSSSSPPPKTRRIVPGLTSSESSTVTAPARNSSSAKRAISAGPRKAATTITETSWIRLLLTSAAPWTPE